jgi:hypothetical protein
MCPLRKGQHQQIKRLVSGKRVRIVYDDAGNVIGTLPLHNKQTKSKRRLARARRRIGL